MGIRRPKACPAERGAPGRQFAAACALALILAVLPGLIGCSYYYSRGQALEAEERWEEAYIAYRLAYVDDPKDPDYKAAVERTSKVVARENFERYQTYLAAKEFRKAYARLADAARQDPELQPVRAEEGKWIRVLIAGQVKLSFDTLRSNLTLADEIKLVARFNTPNPGQTTEAEIDIDTGIFFVEDLLFEPPDQLLTYYTLNSIGVNLIQTATQGRQFSSTEAVRLINFRTPVLERFDGALILEQGETLNRIQDHRAAISDPERKKDYWFPPVNMRYTMSVDGTRIVATNEVARTDFLPRFLYVNRPARRMFVGFGYYEILQDPISRKWGITRLPLQSQDYFDVLSRNVALQPYFFYHGRAVEFLERDRE